MSKMTIDVAKQIILTSSIGSWDYIWHKGWIQGYESRDEEVKGLVEALESIATHNEPPFISEKWQRENKMIAEEALKKVR